MQASALLLRFLADWLKWAEAQDQYPDDQSMVNWTGLCTNFKYWMEQDGLNYEIISEEGHQLYILLGRQHTPFNGRDLPKAHQQYSSEFNNRIFHKNPKRLAWVKQQLGV